MTEDKISLDLADIQGNILRPYGFRHGGYLFVAVRDAAVGRSWLGRLVTPPSGALGVMSAAEWPKNAHPDEALNVAVSYEGLVALGVPDWLLATFPEAFRQGMRGRATALGDVGPSALENWDEGLGGEAHIVVGVRTRDDRRKAEAPSDPLGDLCREIEATEGALELVQTLDCRDLKGQREHFGFADGFGQPAVEGSGHTHMPGQGLPKRKKAIPKKTWAPIKPGEFVLGYEDEDGVRPVAPDPPLGDNGSYMVLRKLEQNVPLFRQFLAENALAFGMSEKLLAAKVVGRWKDGTPLVLCPDRPDPGIGQDKKRTNNFRYGDDPGGHRCPIGAHIRRVNPRDSMDAKGQLTKRHRMLRRGMPYGDPLPKGGTDPHGRGLLFVCFVSDIERQFEVVQRNWCDDGDAFGLGNDRDFLAGRPTLDGERPNKMTIEGRRPIFIEAPEEPFVVTKGGDYYFAPGLRALRALAEADW